MQVKTDMPLVLALSEDDQDLSIQDEAMNANELQEHLSTFLSYLNFTQDAIEHCYDIRMKNSLLSNLENVFVKQLLCVVL